MQCCRDDDINCEFLIGIFSFLHTDLEYWKTPSRRFYAVRRAEYDELLKQKEKNRLTLSKKRKMVTVDLTNEEDVKHPCIARMESNIEMVCAFACSSIQFHIL